MREPGGESPPPAPPPPRRSAQEVSLGLREVAVALDAAIRTKYLFKGGSVAAHGDLAPRTRGSYMGAVKRFFRSVAADPSIPGGADFLDWLVVHSVRLQRDGDTHLRAAVRYLTLLREWGLRPEPFGPAAQKEAKEKGSRDAEEAAEENAREGGTMHDDAKDASPQAEAKDPPVDIGSQGKADAHAASAETAPSPAGAGQARATSGDGVAPLGGPRRKEPARSRAATEINTPSSTAAIAPDQRDTIGAGAAKVAGGERQSPAERSTVTAPCAVAADAPSSVATSAPASAPTTAAASPAVTASSATFSTSSAPAESDLPLRDILSVAPAKKDFLSPEDRAREQRELLAARGYYDAVRKDCSIRREVLRLRHDRLRREADHVVAQQSADEESATRIDWTMLKLEMEHEEVLASKRSPQPLSTQDADLANRKARYVQTLLAELARVRQTLRGAAVSQELAFIKAQQLQAAARGKLLQEEQAELAEKWECAASALAASEQRGLVAGAYASPVANALASPAGATSTAAKAAARTLDAAAASATSAASASAPGRPGKGGNINADAGSGDDVLKRRRCDASGASAEARSLGAHSSRDVCTGLREVPGPLTAMRGTEADMLRRADHMECDARELVAAADYYAAALEDFVVKCQALERRQERLKAQISFVVAQREAFRTRQAAHVLSHCRAAAEYQELQRNSAAMAMQSARERAAIAARASFLEALQVELAMAAETSNGSALEAEVLYLRAQLDCLPGQITELHEQERQAQRKLGAARTQLELRRRQAKQVRAKLKERAAAAAGNRTERGKATS